MGFFSPDEQHLTNGKPTCSGGCAAVREFWATLAMGGCAVGGTLGGAAGGTFVGGPGVGTTAGAVFGGTVAGGLCYVGAKHALFDGMTEDF